MTANGDGLSVAERRRMVARWLRWLGLADFLCGLGLLLAGAPFFSGGAALIGTDGDVNGLLMIAGAVLALMGLAMWAFGRLYGRGSATGDPESSGGVVSRR